MMSILPYCLLFHEKGDDVTLQSPQDQLPRVVLLVNLDLFRSDQHTISEGVISVHNDECDERKLSKTRLQFEA